jgi:transporter family-2 protein
MKIQYLLLTVLLGVVLAVHLAMNGKVGAALNNARVGNAMFWCIGAVAALAIGMSGWREGALSPLGGVNPVLFSAGAIGACLVFGIAWLIPQVGAGNLMIALLAGQVLGGLVMSQFGWLGSPVQPITLLKMAGVALMVIGVVLSTK